MLSSSLYDYYFNISNVIGSLADDIIYGNSLSNIIQGSDGNDFILGFEGKFQYEFIFIQGNDFLDG